MISNGETTAIPVGTAARRRRGSDRVAAELLDAALHEFAAHGFEGASTRAIASRAGAHQPQINYHFATKELLWRAAIDHLFALLREAIGVDADGETVEQFTTSVRRFVAFSAARPELHRIMDLESTAPSARLDWIVEYHAGPMFEIVSERWAAVRRNGAGADLAAIDVWMLLVGVGALPFANAPVLQRFGGPDPSDADRVREHANWVLSLMGLGAKDRGATPRTSRRKP